eukprot:scaffold4410_cov44-Attheya_sp.AAC.7
MGSASGGNSAEKDRAMAKCSCAKLDKSCTAKANAWRHSSSPNPKLLSKYRGLLTPYLIQSSAGTIIFPVLDATGILVRNALTRINPTGLQDQSQQTATTEFRVRHKFLNGSILLFINVLLSSFQHIVKVYFGEGCARILVTFDQFSQKSNGWLILIKVRRISVAILVIEGINGTLPPVDAILGGQGLCLEDGTFAVAGRGGQVGVSHSRFHPDGSGAIIAQPRLGGVEQQARHISHRIKGPHQINGPLHVLLLPRKGLWNHVPSMQRPGHGTRRKKPRLLFIPQ